MKAFILSLLFFAALLLIASGNETPKEVLVLHTWLNSYNKPSQNDQLRPKRETTHFYCGPQLLRKINDVCKSCDRSAPKTKRSVSDNTKNKSNLVKYCCQYGCTSDDLKAYCC